MRDIGIFTSTACNIQKITTRHGFSLIEILVAFTILALSLGVLMNVFTTNMYSSRLVMEYSQATDVAESVLAQIGKEISILNGPLEGNILRFNWRLNVTPYQIADMVQPPPKHRNLLCGR